MSDAQGPTARAERIRVRLAERFSPAVLEVHDESHLHRGHAGARSGKGHFRVVIEAAALRGQTRLAAHRMIYAAVGELFDTDIHALSIELRGH